MTVVDRLSDQDELQRSVRDLAALSALPAVWAGLSSTEICESMARTLLEMLEAELVLVTMGVAGIAAAYTRVGSAQAMLQPLQQILRPWLEERPPGRPYSIPNPLGSGDLKIVTTPILFRERAAIVVGVRDRRFPSSRQQLLLNFIANQTTTALHFWQVEGEQRRYQSLVERSSDFIGLAGLDGQVQFVNTSGLSIVGLSKLEDALGRDVLEFVAEEDRERVREEIWPLAMARGRWTGEIAFRNFNGGPSIPLLVEWFMLNDYRTGEPSCMATVSRDLSPPKRSELQRLNNSHKRPSISEVEIAAAAAQVDRLTPREREVLSALAAGRSQKLIAHDLGISVRTVEVHRSRMLQRLGTRHLAHAIRLWIVAALDPSAL
ncbi:MAG TPA: LuxR C-terminal-related transcriptional regulator [Arsenicitalea sp.]|jgi:PAS domain S-box-containing protein|nr:LuxR C-terminal-related transcriptional regulator [Arsenicitalea sp.]